MLKRKRAPAKRTLRPRKSSNKTAANSSDDEESSSKSQNEDDGVSDKVSSAQTPVFEMVIDGGRELSRHKDEQKSYKLNQEGNNLTHEDCSGIENSGTHNIEVQACLVCLSTRTPLTRLPPALTPTYARCSQAAPLVRAVCVLCERRLRTVMRFHHQCQRAAELLGRLLRHGELTQWGVEKIDRNAHNLKTDLSIRHFPPNRYDKEYIFDDSATKSEKFDTECEINEQVNDEVKLEVPASSPNTAHYIDNDSYDDPIDINNVDAEISKEEETSRTETPKSKALKRKPAKLKTVRTKAVKRNKIKNLAVKIANDEIKEANRRKIDKEKIKTEVQKKMDEYFAVTIFKTVEEKIEELQKRKENSSYINAPLKCEHCFQGYLDNETYDLHMHKHTDNYGGFVCVVCQYRCPSKERLRQHLYFRHSRKFNCKVCPFESHDKYRATLHMKFHEGKTYKCKHCEKVFNHIVNLHNHLRAKHPSDNVCDLCGYSFIGERGLSTHRSLSHGHHLRLRTAGRTIPEGSPSCGECKVSFISEEALQLHLKVSPKHGKSIENFKKRNYHQLHRSIKSSADGKPRKDKEKLTRKRDGIRTGKREIRLTKFDEPVPCEKCGINIESASEYHYHFKRSHPNEKRTWYPTDTHPHLCDICGKMLRNNALKDHMLEHQDGITFKCDVCGKRFSKKFNMKLHARVHLGERYPCQLCGKLFNHMGNRDRHVKYVHTESKDFKCECCGKCFKNDGARKLHTAHVHLRKPYPKRNRQRDLRAGEKPTTDPPNCYNDDLWE